MTPAQRLARLPGCWRLGVRWSYWSSAAGARVWTRLTEECPQPSPDELRDAELDLTDPATRGCLAEWAREVCGDPFLHATPTIGRTGWRIACGRGTTVTGRNGIYVEAADTEGDAWAAAILATLEQP